MGTTVIVGGGCSATLAAVHLLNRSSPGTHRVVLIERSIDVGPGIAHGTLYERHLLNVPARDMSAFPDDPGHFVRWLGEGIHAVHGGDFVPRRLYGQYLRTVLRDAAARAGEEALLVLRGQATDLISGPGQPVMVRCRTGGSVRGDAAILATGHLPPRHPAAVTAKVKASGRYIGDPWSTDQVRRIPPSASVLLLGTGLTAVDLVLALVSQGHAGPIHALSRHGLLPLAHLSVPDLLPVQPGSRLGPPSLANPADAATAGSLVRALRTRAAAAARDGGDWRPVVDDLRPHSNRIWARLPQAEQRRILRHARTYWNIHRHRLAPEAAAWVADLQASGQLTVGAGRLDRCEPTTTGLGVHIARSVSGRDGRCELDVGYLINCTGPELDMRRAGDPLLESLLDRGLASPGILGIGLAVTEEGSLVDRSGQANPRLWTIGPPRQGTLWETTAVPELRVQAAALAARLLTAGQHPSYEEAV